MDNSFLLQLIKKDLEEIQSLIQHFEKNPTDLSTGIDLAFSKTENLFKEFQLLRNNLQAKLSDDNGIPFISQKSTEVKVVEVQQQEKEHESPANLLEKTERDEENLEPLMQEEITVEYRSESAKHEFHQKESPEILGEKFSTKAIRDIRAAIGINDRFLFIRELFEQKADDYNRTIDYINQAKSFDTVMEWVNSEYNWDMENPHVQHFLEITRRKFN